MRLLLLFVTRQYKVSTNHGVATAVLSFLDRSAIGNARLYGLEEGSKFSPHYHLAMCFVELGGVGLPISSPPQLEPLMQTVSPFKLSSCLVPRTMQSLAELFQQTALA